MATSLAEVAHRLLTAVEVSERGAGASLPLYVTGHRHGAAYAQLFGWLLVRDLWDVRGIYTVASPKVGNADQVQAFDRELGDRLVRLYRGDDPVPVLAKFLGYARSEREIDLLETRVSRSGGGRLTPTGLTGSAFPAAVREHFPDSYVAQLRTLLDGSW